MVRTFKHKDREYKNDFVRVGDAMVDANKNLLWGPNWVDGMWDCDTIDMSKSDTFEWIEGNFYD
jgi:hypothetical protein